MAPTLKLTYFNGKGRGENIRMILSYLGLKFEDIRVNYADFGEFKKKTKLPLDMLPTLEIDGKITHQSVAICRFLGKKYNLAGKDECDALQCDMIADSVQDIYKNIWEYRMATGAKKETEEITMKTVTIPKFFTYFNEEIKKHNGFTSSSQITWSDFFVAFLVEELVNDFTKSCMESYPDVVGLKDKIYSHPKVAEWVAKRPSNEMF